MEGSYRSIQKKGKPHRTNFNDWSDTLLKRLESKTKTTEDSVPKHERKAKLKRLSRRTAHTQTVDDIIKLRLMVKQGEPLLPHREIRRLRLPLFNGLVLNLQDDGYPGTSDYIKELIVLDNMYGKRDPNRAVLRSEKTVLYKLAEGIKLAENAQKQQDRTGEAKAFLDLALFFMNSDSSFYWLAEELLEQGMGLLDNPRKPVDPQIDATLRFVYSLFLFEKIHDLKSAKFHLQISMKLSIGKNFWFIDNDGKKGDILFLKSCAILSKITLEEALEQKSTNIEQSILSCRNSLNWAKQANDKSEIATALLTLAGLYIAANQLSPVFHLLQEHITLCKNNCFYRELCEGYVMLSKYHEIVGNDKEVVQVIEELILFALDKGILDIVMKAHLKLAVIYGIRRMGKMKYHAAAAFKYCKLVGSDEQIDLARCLVGISRGDQLWCDYVTLVSTSQNLEADKMTKLIDWKTLGIPFVNDDTTDLYPTEISESLNIKRVIGRVRTEELNIRREEKLQRLTRTSMRSTTQSTPRITASSIITAERSRLATISSSLKSDLESVQTQRTTTIIDPLKQ